MHRLFYAAGETLYRRDTPAESAFLILSGEVAMVRRSVGVTATSGSLVGLSALIERPYGSTATAISDCTLLAFTRRELVALVRSNPEQAMEIIEGILRLYATVIGAIEDAADAAPQPAGAEESLEASGE